MYYCVTGIQIERMDDWSIIYLEGLETYVRHDGYSTVYLHVDKGGDNTFITGLCGNGNGIKSGKAMSGWM